MAEPTSSNWTPYIVPQDIVERRMADWFQAMELSHEMLMAGLQQKIGPNGDLAQAYRENYRLQQSRKWQEIMAVQEHRLRHANQKDPTTIP